MTRFLTLAVLIGALGACVSVPSGPSRLALPGTGKSFDQFRADDLDCRHFASAQVGGADPNQAAGDSVVKSAALGTAVGAVAGAAIGGQRGAGVGAGTGLAVGALAGTGAGGASARTVQQRYDHAFLQCMYGRGHKIPVSGRFESAPQGGGARYSAPPPPPPPR
ncbi:MAG: hypothetical protein HYY28_09770 [Betaproteobacteria bacterium]|nr:hypothetical protein [Betaproteobacteria bacterium]MBI2960590.1 hypothetical protein [Betaproteobacteria bacterium]